MAKQFDYYAGYPNQQRTPKWVGVAIGSVFGVVTLVALGVGVRLAMPARSAEASAIALRPATTAAPVLAAPPVVAAADEAAEVDEQPAPVAKHRLHGKVGKKAKKGHAIALMSKRPTKNDKKMKRAQVYAKSVAGGRRDKRARDDLDKMLGL